MPRKFLGGKPTVGSTDTPVVVESRTITATAPVTIAGTTSADLSADRTIAVSAASTGAAGVVQLSDSTSSTSTSLAATANAVKTAYDLANGAIAKTIVDAKGDLIVATGADAVSRLAVGATNGHVLTVDSAEATGMKWAAASGSSWTLVKATANQSVTNSSTLVDSSYLTFSVAASTTYTARFVVFFITNNSADFKYAITGPASPTIVNYKDAYQTATTASSTSFGTSVQVLSPTGQSRVVVDLLVQNGSNAGTVTFQFAQDVATSGQTLTVYKGSYVEWMSI